MIQRLELLKQIFGNIIIPPGVNNEIQKLQGLEVNLSLYHASRWIKIKVPTDQKGIALLMTDLDKGESEAISFAKRVRDK